MLEDFLIFRETCKIAQDGKCMSLVFSDLLSVAISLGSIFFKLPQILLILGNKSVEGLSLSLVLLEVLSPLSHSVYFNRQGYGLDKYFESIMSLIQSCIIMSLFYQFCTWDTVKENKYSFIIGNFIGIFVLLGIFQLIDSYYMFIVQQAFNQVNSQGRFEQFGILLTTGNQKNISIVTYVLLVAGILARLVTLLIDGKDDDFLIKLVIMVSLFPSMGILLIVSQQNLTDTKGNQVTNKND